MPIQLKKPDEIAGLRAAGRIVAGAFEDMRPWVKPGVSLRELDDRASAFARETSIRPATLGCRDTRATRRAW